MLLGAYFWGYLLTSLPGGILAEWLGGKAVVGYTMGLSGVLAAFTPYSAAIGFYAVYLVRLVTGVLAVSYLVFAVPINSNYKKTEG